MSEVTAPLVCYPNSELVFGVVAPVGTNRDHFLDSFQSLLRGYSFESRIVRLSELIKTIKFPKEGPQVDETTPAIRLDTLMKAGSYIRKETHADDILALMAVCDIFSSRLKETSAGSCRRAHILWSLKHPDEVSLLQQVYGPGFFLIGLYSAEEERLSYLINREGFQEEEARERIQRDQDEEVDSGQKTRDTFQLSDVFIPMTHSEIQNHLDRFLQLVFGNPQITPTSNEHAMFMAYSMAVKSGALGRQVGAVLVSENGDFLGIGTNDAPKAGGGQYWPGPNDQRDLARGFDSNAREKERIQVDIFSALEKAGFIHQKDQTRFASILRQSRLADISEYGRDVHAEMEAILSCARSGIAVRGATLFTTTFPCHNCAKHIIASGIERVVFVEPYPKSRAFELHSDSLSLTSNEQGKVVFEPFIGVGPRRYFDLFSSRLGQSGQIKRKVGSQVCTWERQSAAPRIQLKPLSYLELEAAALELTRRVLGYTCPQGESDHGT